MPNRLVINPTGAAVTVGGNPVPKQSAAVVNVATDADLAAFVAAKCVVADASISHNERRAAALRLGHA